MELRLWCSNRGTLLVPEPRFRWVRGIPHFTDRSPEFFARGQSHQRPPGRDSKSPQKKWCMFGGRKGGVWVGRGGLGNLMWLQPKPDSRNPVQPRKGVLPPTLDTHPTLAVRTWLRIRHPWHCPGRPRGLSISPPAREHCQGWDSSGGRGAGAGAGKGWGCGGNREEQPGPTPPPLSRAAARSPQRTARSVCRPCLLQAMKLSE